MNKIAIVLGAFHWSKCWFLLEYSRPIGFKNSNCLSQKAGKLQSSCRVLYLLFLWNAQYQTVYFFV